MAWAPSESPFNGAAFNSLCESGLESLYRGAEESPWRVFAAEESPWRVFAGSEELESKDLASRCVIGKVS